ncbi:hypothetical protein V493_08600 [Pseudogymnoascus sp. VKM F-4281 (FW-2241)]|nr:hypothetical protein V493_08600 [Pseudogymnoascus sp. VKM F-4281 (FW-2241)]
MASTDDASDSRTSVVGRKRTLQQSVGKTAEVSARSPASDSDGSQPVDRANKRAKPNGNGSVGHDTFPQVTDNSASGADARVENPKDVTAAAMSWNKGVQATVRTSLGGSSKAAKKAAADNKLPAAEKRQEEQPHIVGDTSAPGPGVSQDNIKRGKMTRAQKRALSALDVATTKPVKPADAPEDLNQKSIGSTTSEVMKGNGLILPSPIEKRAKEKPAGYISRDLRTNFVYELFTRNSNSLGKLDLDSIVTACDAYMTRNYSKIEKKHGAVQLKDESFLGFCRNRLKEAKAGTMPSSKPVSTASSLNGRSVGDISTIDSAAALPVHGQGTAVEHSIDPNDRGQKSPAVVSLVPEVAEDDDDYSPEPEPMVLVSSGATRETQQVVSEAEATLINRYYPGLPRGTVRCFTCGSNGHLAASCPQLNCSSCGLHGIHFTNSCPKTIRCTKCYQRGHQKPACPEKLGLTEFEDETCDICGSAHHTEQSCHFLWRSFKPDLGSVRKVRSLLADCYNCGADGHYGPECALSRSASLTGGYTWSMANRDRYVDSKTSLPAISNGSHYLPAKPQNGFSIKGSAKSNPVMLVDSDEEEFIRPKIAPPQPKGHIRFTGRQPVEQRHQPQPPPASSYREPPLSNSYTRNDEHYRFGDGRPYSPPPSYPDYNQGRYDDQYHNFDHDKDYRSNGQPLLPFRGDNGGHRGGPTSGKRSRKGAGSGPPRLDNVAPPQSLTGKKSGRGARNKGGPRGGGRGGANRGPVNGAAIGGEEVELYSRGPGLWDPTCSKLISLKVYGVIELEGPHPLDLFIIDPGLNAAEYSTLTTFGEIFYRPERSSCEPRNVGAETMRDVAKMPETSIPPPPVVTRPSRPVSETLLNEKWDRCLSSLLIRSSLGLSFGVVFSVLIFKRRAWPAFVGLGFGAGRAYEECNSSFIRAGKGPSRS